MDFLAAGSGGKRARIDVHVGWGLSAAMATWQSRWGWSAQPRVDRFLARQRAASTQRVLPEAGSLEACRY